MLQGALAVSQTQPMSPVATPPQESDEEPEDHAFGIVTHSDSRPAKRKRLQVLMPDLLLPFLREEAPAGELSHGRVQEVVAQSQICPYLQASPCRMASKSPITASPSPHSTKQTARIPTPLKDRNDNRTPEKGEAQSSAHAEGCHDCPACVVHSK